MTDHEKAEDGNGTALSRRNFLRNTAAALAATAAAAPLVAQQTGLAPVPPDKEVARPKGEQITSPDHHLVNEQEPLPHNAVLDLYQVHAVTQGTDAQAEVTVRLSEGEAQVSARGADPDTLVASARAYVAALNKLQAKRGKIRYDTLAGQAPRAG